MACQHLRLHLYTDGLFKSPTYPDIIPFEFAFCSPSLPCVRDSIDLYADVWPTGIKVAYLEEDEEEEEEEEEEDPDNNAIKPKAPRATGGGVHVKGST